MRHISTSGILAIISNLRTDELQEIKEMLTWEEADKIHTLYSEVDGKIITYKNFLPILFKDYCPPHPEILFKPKLSEIEVPGIELYDYQKRVIQLCLVKRFGGIISGTGSGKTEMIAGFFLYLFKHSSYKNMWIVVNNSLLAGNIHARLLARGLPDEEVYLYDSKKNKGIAVEKRLTIVVVNSVHSRLKKGFKLLEKKLSESEVVVVDEAHHATTMLYHMLSYCNNLKFLLGFSATLFENPKDPQQLFGDAQAYGLFGQVLKNVSVSELQEAGHIASPYLLFEVIGSKKILNKSSSIYKKYDTVYRKFIVDNNYRNKRMAEFAGYMAEKGLQTFISVVRHDQAFHLLGELVNYSVIAIFGGKQVARVNEGKIVISTEDYEEISQEFKEGKIQILIATAVADEGFDLPSVDCMIMGGGMKTRRGVMQRRGRGARRKKKGMNNFFLIDFWDQTHKYLLKHSEQRLSHYVNDSANITYEWDEYKALIEEYCKERQNED